MDLIIILDSDSVPGPHETFATTQIAQSRKFIIGVILWMVRLYDTIGCVDIGIH